MRAWARKLHAWLLAGHRAIAPNTRDELLRPVIMHTLSRAQGSPTKEAEILAGLAKSFAAAGYTAPMPVIPMRVREAARDVQMAHLLGGYRLLHPTLSDHELAVSMHEAISRDGWPATKARLEREFERIGYSSGPSIK